MTIDELNEIICVAVNVWGDNGKLRLLEIPLNSSFQRFDCNKHFYMLHSVTMGVIRFHSSL